jgi:hypothetical protein
MRQVTTYRDPGPGTRGSNFNVYINFGIQLDHFSLNLKESCAKLSCNNAIYGRVTLASGPPVPRVSLAPAIDARRNSEFLVFVHSRVFLHSEKSQDFSILQTESVVISGVRAPDFLSPAHTSGFPLRQGAGAGHRGRGWNHARARPWRRAGSGSFAD